jgi:diguanylate cyclase (GGDEF)-like protein
MPPPLRAGGVHTPGPSHSLADAPPTPALSGSAAARLAAAPTLPLSELDELLGALLTAKPCEAPWKKPIVTPVPATAAREFPNGRGFLRVVPNGRDTEVPAPSLAAPPSPPCARGLARRAPKKYTSPLFIKLLPLAAGIRAYGVRHALRTRGQRRVRTDRMSRIDARLLEMQLLAQLERGDIKLLESPRNGGAAVGSPERQMVASMIYDGYINGIDSMPRLESAGAGGLWQYYSDFRAEHIVNVRSTFVGVPLYISHKGRVRLSELEQQLKTGRDRDETGLLWAKRHLLVDLAIAILSANQDGPLSVAFLDMNGLKAINDTHGHPAGDEAIRAFFQATVETLGGQGEAYRNGGDEVVVILPGVADEDAGKLLDGFVRQLGKEVRVLGDARAEVRLTASCGSASTTNPNEQALMLLKRADGAEIRAKNRSKEHAPRVSAFGVGDGAVTTYAPGG